jgi:hypothetical protein
MPRKVSWRKGGNPIAKLPAQEHYAGPRHLASQKMDRDFRNGDKGPEVLDTCRAVVCLLGNQMLRDLLRGMSRSHD